MAQAPPVPLAHPASLLLFAVTAACVLLSVTFRTTDLDLWQHLAVGRAIAQLHRVPTLQLWSWPTYGTPDVTSSYSWGFRALLWPLWQAGGFTALSVLRWIVALGVFGLLFATARRLGARGLATAFVLVVAALAFRQRAQIRPELLASLLLALTVWLLESRRQGGPDRTPWLIPVLWAWANVHISWPLGLLLVGVYLLAGRRPRNGPRLAAGRLASIALACAAVVFLNPYGWRAVWQPFEFALVTGREPIMRGIVELRPLVWREHLRDGFVFLLVAWPVLLLLRARRRGLDPVEAILCLVFTALAVSAWRFLGFHAVVAAPFVARNLDDALATVRVPRWSLAPWPRAAIVAAASALAGFAEWSRADLPIGIAADPRGYPFAACDFMASHGIRGRGFTPYHFGGYLLWRFWPERDRLPFMDIHQSGTRAIRDLDYRAFVDPSAWRALDERYRFDYVMLDRIPVPGETLLDRLDVDPTWALVFLDDRAALWVRRDGPLAAAARESYRLVPAGIDRLRALAGRWPSDSLLADSLAAELRRMAASSPQSAAAWNLLGRVEWDRGHMRAAREAFEHAIAPGLQGAPGAHAFLARIALAEGRPGHALELCRGAARFGASSGLATLEGRAYAALGDRRRARAAYRRELAADPGAAEARDSLEALERSPGP